MYADILILSYLVNRPSYGYEIKKRVPSILGQDSAINNNQLYPALRRFHTGDLVKRDRLYEVMCTGCADDYRNIHAEQLRADLLATKARLAQLRRIARRSLEEYFQTPEWRAKSNAAKIRAGNRCQICKRADVQLDTHHNCYDRLGAELLTDLIVLCRDCHQLYHDYRRLPDAA